MKTLTPDTLCRYLSGDARTMAGMLQRFGPSRDLPRLVKLGREVGAIVTFTPHGLGAAPRYEAVEGLTFTDPENGPSADEVRDAAISRAEAACDAEIKAADHCRDERVAKAPRVYEEACRAAWKTYRKTTTKEGA